MKYKLTVILLLSLFVATGVCALSYVEPQQTTPTAKSMSSTKNSFTPEQKERIDSLFINTKIAKNGKIDYHLLTKCKVFEYQQIEYSTSELLYILSNAFFSQQEQKGAGTLEITDFSKENDEYYVELYADITKVAKKLLFLAPKQKQFFASCNFRIVEQQEQQQVQCYNVSHPLNPSLIKAVMLLCGKNSPEQFIEQRLTAIFQNIGYLKSNSDD